MRQENPVELLITIVIYIFIGYALFSIFIGLFPAVIVLCIAAAFIAGVFLLYRYIRSGLFEKGHSSKLDEHGSRKIKASVIEMKEFEPGAEKKAENKDKVH